MGGLYIHIPFCHSKCAYCDFFSTPNNKSEEAVISAIINEIAVRRYEIPEYETLYIGGGTPSMLKIEQLQRLLSSIDISQMREVTIEVNPEDITDEFAQSIKKLGINRVSMGIQTFNDNELKAINRRHSAAEAINAIDTLHRVGITNISGDLIYGLPGQTMDSWKHSLDILFSKQLTHFSAYILSYEPGTLLHARLSTGKIKAAEDELIEDMYGCLIQEASNHGFEHYEISNFCIPGFKSIHNSNYWFDKPYLGVGPAAHSFTNGTRRINPSNIKSYLAGDFEIEEENEIERINDKIIVGLRHAIGLDLSELSNAFKHRILDQAKGYLDSGDLIYKNEHLSIKESSWLISDMIMRDLIQS